MLSASTLSVTSLLEKPFRNFFQGCASRPLLLLPWSAPFFLLTTSWQKPERKPADFAAVFPAHPRDLADSCRNTSQINGQFHIWLPIAKVSFWNPISCPDLIPLLRILGTLPGASLPAPIMPMTGACTSTPAEATLEPSHRCRILLPLACLLRACARHPACRDFATPPLPALP